MARKVSSNHGDLNALTSRRWTGEGPQCAPRPSSRLKRRRIVSTKCSSLATSHWSDVKAVYADASHMRSVDNNMWNVPVAQRQCWPMRAKVVDACGPDPKTTEPKSALVACMTGSTSRTVSSSAVSSTTVSAAPCGGGSTTAESAVSELAERAMRRTLSPRATPSEMPATSSWSPSAPTPGGLGAEQDKPEHTPHVRRVTSHRAARSGGEETFGNAPDPAPCCLYHSAPLTLPAPLGPT